MNDDWVIEEGVRCVVCPRCAFTFDASHVDVATGGYSCPVCVEARFLRRFNEDGIDVSTKDEGPGSCFVVTGFYEPSNATEAAEDAAVARTIRDD